VPALARARVTYGGETVDEAIAMAREAVEVYIESLRERFRPKKGAWNTGSQSKSRGERPGRTP